MNNNQNNSEIINVIDVRTPGEFISGHVDGSINIPLNELMDNIDKLKGMEGHIILCCASGGRSGSALYSLRQLGFNNVSNGGPWYEVQNSLSNNR